MVLGRPRAFDKDTALDRALTVFWEKGYEGTSISDLTAAMGVNPPSLYAAFGNKQALFKLALDRYEARRDEILAEAFAAPTAREAMARLLLGTADRLSDKTAPRGCLMVHGALCGGEDCENVKRDLAARRADRRSHDPRAFAARQEARRPAGERRSASPGKFRQLGHQRHGREGRQWREPQGSARHRRHGALRLARIAE